MNHYEYKCRNCKQVTRVICSMSNIPEPEDVQCSHCDEPDMFRKFGGGVSVWQPTKFS